MGREYDFLPGFSQVRAKWVCLEAVPALIAPAPWSGGAQNVPLTIPPLPTPSPPFSRGGEGRGEGRLYTHVPCPLGALLVTLYHFKSKAFLM